MLLEQINDYRRVLTSIVIRFEASNTNILLSKSIAFAEASGKRFASGYIHKIHQNC